MVAKGTRASAIALLCLALPAAVATAVSPSSRLEQRLRDYQGRVRTDPRHYPSWAELGAVLVAVARNSHDPGDVARAEQAIDRSLAIQVNYAAIKGKALLACFRHRFDEAVRWGKLAHDTWPADPEAVSLLVEAYLGLGELDRAEALLDASAEQPRTFHLAAARGHLLKAQQRFAAATQAFLQASELARADADEDLVVWGEAAAAGALLDGGRCAEARPILDRAAAVSPGHRLVRLHQVELAECEGHLDQALALGEQLLEEQPDPELGRQLFVLARRLGRDQAALRHLRAAKLGFEAVVAAGEAWSLEGLARLLLDAGLEPERALELAITNFEFKHDRPSQEVLECARLGAAAR